MTHASLPDIGQRFGGFDHTTVMYARDRIAALAEQDPAFKAELEDIARADPPRALSLVASWSPRAPKSCNWGLGFARLLLVSHPLRTATHARSQGVFCIRPPSGMPGGPKARMKQCG